jgi:hypothetical protein
MTMNNSQLEEEMFPGRCSLSMEVLLAFLKTSDGG